MVALIVVLAGYALIFGAGDFAKKALRTVAGLILVLSFLPGLFDRIRRTASSAARPGTTIEVSFLPLIVIAALALVGLVAWRTRAGRARAREEQRRVHGSPRERALPPAPPNDEDEA